MPPGSGWAQTRHALLIGGLGGSPEYSSSLRQYLFDTHSALVGSLGFAADNVTVLAEPASAQEPAIDGVANADNIRTAFADLVTQVSPQDHVYIFLFGHGSSDGREAMLNIARRDLTSADYTQLVDRLPAARIIFINTASASGPFIAALSAPDRIIITATRSDTQRNQTIFPRFMVDAFSDPSADLDRDGSLSVLEIFRYTALTVAAHYSDGGHLATEHALIDDTGNKEGTRLEDLADKPDGHLAAVTYLRQSATAGIMHTEKEAILRDVAALKARKGTMDVDVYYDALELLLIRLARLASE